MRLVTEGNSVSICTVFTRSSVNPQGFALACQLDKGLPPDVDYMALRRAEDLRFAEFAGTNCCLHLAFKEAPHRGYENAADLFNGVHQDDEIWGDIAEALTELASSYDWVVAPQGLGNHVDHLQTIMAVEKLGLKHKTQWYRDTPYAIRNPAALPSKLLGTELCERRFPIDLAKKITGCKLYITQVPFQFGSNELLERKLENFHRTEAGYSESLLFTTEANISPSQSRTITRGS